MKIFRVQTPSVPMLAACLIALTALLVPAAASASERSGKLRVTKECSEYTGLAVLHHHRFESSGDTRRFESLL